MFDLIRGVPVHPLVIHAVVVLIPLGIVGTLAIAAVPAWRVRYGWLVVAILAAGTASIPVATRSGAALQKRVGLPDPHHAALGRTLIYFAVPLLLLVLAMVVLAHRPELLGARDDRAGGADGGSSRAADPHARTRGAALVPLVIAVLASVIALASLVQVYRIGDSGARQVWEQRVQSQP